MPIRPAVRVLPATEPGAAGEEIHASNAARLADRMAKFLGGHGFDEETAAQATPEHWGELARAAGEKPFSEATQKMIVDRLANAAKDATMPRLVAPSANLLKRPQALSIATQLSDLFRQ